MYEDIIENCSLFQGVSAHFKQQFLAEHEVQHFQPTTRVVQQNTPSDGMYIVLNGELEVRVSEANKSDPEKPIATLRPSHYFGEVSMISEKNRTANVDTKTYADLMFIKRDNFQQGIANRDPDALMIVYNIANLLVNRLTETNHLIAKLVTAPSQSSELTEIRQKLSAIEIL